MQGHVGGESLGKEVKDVYGLDDEVSFRNVNVPSENRPRPLHLGTATQIVACLLCKQNLLKHVRNLLNVLSLKERKIIKLRFGIDGGKQRSLYEIGEIYGLSKERVRQLESQALYRLKQNMNSHGLIAYADLLV
ncbi:unnamed protein product [Eruca vesicaria subsp. sativa]|uniref:RNA polymerase sigma-70 domain-containing protein n=1 Tax=Eruca vesicaria subsp. sativa TaxID=29727 RepID=A0ABC8JAY2_ERUVS|nr:unnamed protein product [Eruca vesicaria subsp. sativa]